MAREPGASGIRRVELRILHADNHLLAVVKPPGEPVVPDDSGDPSLLDRAKAWVKREYGKPGRVYLGVVHRLDRPVGGVMLFARTSKASARLADAWRRGDVAKRYLAFSEERRPELTAGAAGELVQRLWKDRERNRVRVLGESGPEPPGTQEARTRWEVVAASEAGTWLALEPLTGRPHQLRVACAALGLPLAGDLKYGAARPRPDRCIALHAWRLEVPHPTRDERVRLEAPPPGWARLPSGAGG